jgi:RNA polymerase sigma factor (sigma-70 family)
MTDEMIMEAVKRGELQQASVLFERYNKRVFNFLARMTMDRDVAEDLTQNVFLRVMKYKDSYKDGARFQSWIYQIARNIFSDHYHHMPDSAESELADEREKRLHKSMAKLGEEQRELLILTRFQQMKYEEVALIMDTTVANIKVKVHRAIAKLREHYFELEGE